MEGHGRDIQHEKSGIHLISGSILDSKKKSKSKRMQKDVNKNRK